jgi:hypothetical protein
MRTAPTSVLAVMACGAEELRRTLTIALPKWSYTKTLYDPELGTRTVIAPTFVKASAMAGAAVRWR